MGNGDEVTLIQMVPGSDSGAARRTGLNEEQRAGDACLVCGGTHNLGVDVGWVEGRAVRVHSHHVEAWRMGRTL